MIFVDIGGRQKQSNEKLVFIMINVGGFVQKESARTAAKGTSSAITSIQDNKVPYSFLIMFLVQFILMIIDRALYLRKNRQGKFIFQVLLVLFVHVWVFFVLPYITKL